MYKKKSTQDFVAITIASTDCLLKLYLKLLKLITNHMDFLSAVDMDQFLNEIIKLLLLVLLK